MSLVLINHDELHSIQRELEQALYSHIQWHNALIRTLTCRLQGDRHDIGAQPHKECLFGQWYYEHSPMQLRKHPGYIAIGEAHQLMHQAAVHLIQTSNVHNTIEPSDYDNFAYLMERLRLEIFSLKREIDNSLYTHDSLTGAINRIDMLPMLRELHDIAKRESRECCIGMMDLDNFKNVNDKYGHPKGDKVLSNIVRYIINNLRAYDKIFRYGGEEFLISMQNVGLNDGYQRIEELRKGISTLEIKLSQNSIHMTVSFGITLLDPNFSIEQCIQNADEALYNSKASGRNCTKIWTPPKGQVGGSN